MDHLLQIMSVQNCDHKKSSGRPITDSAARLKLVVISIVLANFSSPMLSDGSPVKFGVLSRCQLYMVDQSLFVRLLEVC